MIHLSLLDTHTSRAIPIDGRLGTQGNCILEPVAAAIR
jgi:hypothetical protein